MLEIRHPLLKEMKEVADILLLGFYDKFSYIFRDNLKLGKKIYKELFFKYFKDTDRLRYLVAVQDNKILGTIQFHVKSKLPKIPEILSIFNVLIRNFRLFNFLRKFLILLLMKSESVEKDSCYISSFAVRPEARNQGVGKRLLKSVEKIASSRNCKHMTLDVIYRNKKARNLYEKLGYKLTKTISSSLLVYFLGINGSCHMKKELENE